jgi:putative Mg2+ transporter-C (MgtC) family protein
MLLSLHLPTLFYAASAVNVVRADPARIAASVLTGLGFLGAGAILVLGQHVRGLTTAACIWVTAAIGLAVGAGYLIPALFCHILVMFSLLAVDRWAKRMERKDRYVRVQLTFPQAGRRAAAIGELLRSHGFDVLECTANRQGERAVYQVHLRYTSTPDFEAVTQALADELGEPAPCEVRWK